MEKGLWKKVIPLSEFLKYLFYNVMHLRVFILLTLLVYSVNSLIFYQAERTYMAVFYNNCAILSKAFTVMLDYVLLVHLSRYTPVTTLGKFNAVVSSLIGLLFIGLFVGIVQKSFEDIELRDTRAFFFTKAK